MICRAALGLPGLFFAADGGRRNVASMADADADNINQAIADNAATPSSVSVDGTTTSNRPLGELVQAAKHAANVQAGKNPAAALRSFRIVPPGDAH